MGGDDNKDNISILTAEEHFLAHQLLVRIYPGNQKLIFSVKMMTVSGGTVVRNNKMFGWLKRKYSEILSTRIFTDDTRRKMAESATNKIVTDETRQRMSKAGKGRVSKYKGVPIHSEETKKIIGEAGKRPCKEETKIKIGLANAGRILPPVSEETREKLSLANTGYVHKKVICPYCNKQGGETGMKAWHFEKCKEYNVYN
jgi:hypothetical protein